MKRGFRLTRSNDFKRVRRYGKSYAHPLVVLYALQAEQTGLRVGVSAGLSIGNAVKRNRARRLLRAAMSELIPLTSPGSDLLLIARPGLRDSNLAQTRAALSTLLERAGLIVQSHDA